MPLYHYECRNCGHEMELRQGFGDAPPECPVCATLMRRRLFPVGVVFKGSGFYSTDNRSGAASAESEAAKSGAGRSEAGRSEAGKSKDSAGGEAKGPEKESSTSKVETD